MKWQATSEPFQIQISQKDMQQVSHNKRYLHIEKLDILPDTGICNLLDIAIPYRVRKWTGKPQVNRSTCKYLKRVLYIVPCTV